MFSLSQPYTPNLLRAWPGRATAIAAILGALLLTACPGATDIGKLLDDPSRFDGRKVRIAGVVKESVGGFGLGVYQINDGTGTLTVVSQAGAGTPRVGAEVGVEGQFRSAFTLGSRSLAVLVEQKRRTR